MRAPQEAPSPNACPDGIRQPARVVLGPCVLWEGPSVPKLEQLRADHAQAILAFERDNRAYFATSISDRGDEFFDHFAERYRDLLAEQEAGSNAFYVLVDDEGEVIGRFNLYDLEDCAAKVGYRVAQHVAGHGVATAAVRELCAIAASLGLHTLIAATAHENVASQTRIHE